MEFVWLWHLQFAALISVFPLSSIYYVLLQSIVSFSSHFLSLRYSRWFCMFLSMSIKTVEYAYFILRSYSVILLRKFYNLFGRLTVSETAVKKDLHLTPLFLIWIRVLFLCNRFDFYFCRSISDSLIIKCSHRISSFI